MSRRRIFVSFCFLALFFVATNLVTAFDEDFPKIEIPRHVSYIVGTDKQAASFILSPLLPEDFMIYLERDSLARNDLVLENSDSVVVFPKREKALGGYWGGYVDYPYIRLLPTHPLYFYIRWKEKRSIARAVAFKEKADLHLLYAAKRLVELERLLKKNSPAEVVENTLARHKYHVEELFNALREGWAEDRRGITKNILKTEVYILNFEEKIAGLEGMDLEEKQQEIFSLYREVLSWIGGERKGPQDLVYSLNLPKSGRYAVLMEKEKVVDSFDKDPYREGVVSLDSKVATFSGDLNQSWAVFKPIKLDKEQSELVFTLPEFVNLVDDGSFEKEGESFDAIDGQRSKRLSTIGVRRIEIPIKDYDPRLGYRISFYYKTLMGKNFDFVILGEDAEGERVEVFRKTLSPTAFWDDLFHRLGPTYTMKSLKIVLEYPDWILAGEMSLVDNLVVNVDWEPKLVLVLIEGKDIEEIFAPQREKINLSFDKLDLFEYRVALEDPPKDPFFLVLNQTFHERQRLFPGLFCEQKDFWCKVSGSWGRESLDDQFHFKANGFANGWFINPKIVPEEKFTIEFWFQKIYYLGLGVIGATFVGGIILLVGEKFWSMVSLRLGPPTRR